jgi:hypothetical protein
MVSLMLYEFLKGSYQMKAYWKGKQHKALIKPVILLQKNTKYIIYSVIN